MQMSSFCNKDAEVQILGAIFKNNDVLCEFIEDITYEDFYIERHKFIYKNMVELYKNNIPIEMVTLNEKLGASLASVGGITYLSELAGSSASTKNVKSYARIIKEKSNLRRLQQTLREALREVEEKNLSAEKVGETVGEKLLQISSAAVKESGEVQQPLEELIQLLDNRKETGGEGPGIRTGYRAIDYYLGGFQKDDLIILAARPSMGKTAVALNLALKTAAQKKAKVAFFNLEMGKQQLLERAVSLSTSIPMFDLRQGTFSDEERNKIEACRKSFPFQALRIYDKTFTVSGIRAECKKLKLKEGLDIVLIDYLQLIQGEERAENRVQEVSKITRRLKLMAKELEITVIALAQLSRAPEARLEHRPMLSDLRESGSIEQDADIVMFLYRDEYYNRESEDKGILECIFAKHRNGEIGTAKLRWLPQVQQIQEFRGLKS